VSPGRAERHRTGAGPACRRGAKASLIQQEGSGTAERLDNPQPGQHSRAHRLSARRANYPLHNVPQCAASGQALPSANTCVPGTEEPSGAPGATDLLLVRRSNANLRRKVRRRTSSGPNLQESWCAESTGALPPAVTIAGGSLRPEKAVIRKRATAKRARRATPPPKSVSRASEPVPQAAPRLSRKFNGPSRLAGCATATAAASAPQMQGQHRRRLEWQRRRRPEWPRRRRLVLLRPPTIRNTRRPGLTHIRTRGAEYLRTAARLQYAPSATPLAGIPPRCRKKVRPTCISYKLLENEDNLTKHIESTGYYLGFCELLCRRNAVQSKRRRVTDRCSEPLGQ